jgi:hypothetical protein
MTWLPFVLSCALRYAIAAFGAGIVLGIFRNLVLAPLLGSLAALAIELPVILAISWFLAKKFVLAAIGVRAPIFHFVLAGAIAFAALILAEYILGKFAMGLTLSQFAGSWTTLEGAIGLLAQMLFGLFPLLQRLLTSADERRSR